MRAATISALVACIFALAGEAPFHALSFDQALAKAQADKKLVFVDFFTTWCAPCKKLDATTWKDADVQRWFAEQTIALKLDAEQETELAKRFKIESYPTMLLLLKPDGSEVDRLVGYRDAKTFLADVTEALAGKNSLTRAKEKLIGNEQRPTSHQRYADELARNGRDEEALQEYLWCFDHGAKARGYSAVRTSFLLSSIVRLGQRYPAALDALKTRCDAAELRILENPDSFDDLQEFAALNRELKQDERTLATFDQLIKKGPPSFSMRLTFGPRLLSLLREARRYGDLLSLIDKPEKQVRDSIAQVKRMDAPDQARELEPQMREALEAARRMRQDQTVAECSCIFEALIGTKNTELAGKIADLVIEFAPAGATYATLIEAAVRASDSQSASALLARATQALPETQLTPVREAAKSIPAVK